MLITELSADLIRSISMFLPLGDIFHMHLVHPSFHAAIGSQDFWFAQLSLHDGEVPNLYNGDYKTQFQGCYQFGDSKILQNFQQRKLLREWYGSSENWRCVFRASEHSYKADHFHAICDSLGATLSIIRCTNGYIFGGYTSISWGIVCWWLDDPKAFLFSLVNPSNEPAKLMLGDANDTYAMGADPQYFFIFGGIDLVIRDNCNTALNSTQVNYTFKLPDHLKHIDGEVYLTGGKNFLVDEMEVFVDRNRISDPEKRLAEQCNLIDL